MAKFQSPLLGYNNNVRHKNRVFHIQTEDSGVNHPHIITHLFMDGGRILKSVKKSYAEHVGADGMSEIVRGLMKEQHKAMFIALRDGQFDALVEPGGVPVAAGSEPKLPEPKAAKADAKAAAKTDAKADVKADAKPEPKPEPKPSVRPVAKPPEPILKPSDPELAPVTIDENKRPPRHSAPPPASGPKEKQVASSPKVDIPPSEPVPTTLRDRPIASAKELTLDFDALEMAAQDGASSLFHTNDLPPPPKNLFAKERGTGTYRAIDAEEPAPSSRSKPSVPPPPSARDGGKSPNAPRVRGSGRPGSDARYAPARPAAIFGSSNRPPQQAAPSLGDELLSDKSLDEVILSYLAEDLEPPRRK